MEAEKINPQQLQDLFAFTRKHFVEYHDLQAELADHLANAIEERWQQQPGLSFNEALQAEFKKFGIFGFSDIVEQRQNALFKRYHRLVWQEFRSALDIRMALIIAFSSAAIFMAVLFFPWSYALLLLLFFGVSSYKLWQIKKHYRQKLEATGKKWLLEEIIFNCGGLGVMMTLPLQFALHMPTEALTPMLAAVMTALLVLLFVYDYIVLFRMPGKAVTYLQKVYPEYGLENLS